jgi:hypothetical protein
MLPLVGRDLSSANEGRIIYRRAEVKVLEMDYYDHTRHPLRPWQLRAQAEPYMRIQRENDARKQEVYCRLRQKEKEVIRLCERYDKNEKYGPSFIMIFLY